MKKLLVLVFASITIMFFSFKKDDSLAKQWIRINQLGYTPNGVKVAVWCSKEADTITSFVLVDSSTGKRVAAIKAGRNFGSYGPFKNTYRLNFTAFNKPGIYYLKAGKAKSPPFKINSNVLKGAADFCLQYMRQQRSGFNPYLNDSCHTHDGYTMYGPMPDSTFMDVSGGWHDASDYLQYSATSANATWHLLAAYRDFPKVFGDTKQSNGLDGSNAMADVLDEAVWGLDWLLKMFPQKDRLFNQLGDDRDHMGMRIPKEDSFYGKGFERPVYFVSGEPQGLFKYKNRTTGTSSTAAKFAGAFALAQSLINTDSVFHKYSKRRSYYDKAFEAYQYALKKPGVTQTAPGRAPYYYEEDNWVDDMELALASVHDMIVSNKGGTDMDYYTWLSYTYAQKEKVTPWLGADTARHYQWYPFINAGHYELAKQLKNYRTIPLAKDTVISYYKTGIERVWNKAKNNAFYRGIPFIWCSNNLTTSFAIQCYWYKQLTGNKSFDELEQANFDWLFGCNPWGTSMVYGLPSWGDTPIDPHSAFTHLKNYPINGGLVDGPVYTSIYRNLIGIHLNDGDEYEYVQSDLAVYHDDFGDYSTNEPTMDGTASLIYLLAAKEAGSVNSFNNRATGKAPTPESVKTLDHGAVIRGNMQRRKIALVFTGHEFADGGKKILSTLKKYHANAAFFFTGWFYRNPSFKKLVTQIRAEGHYLGPHSDQHLLYCDWTKRDSLLVTKQQFYKDLSANLESIQQFGVKKSSVQYFMPPYEWHNDSIAAWSKGMGMQLINFTPGTRSNADYTYPELNNYRNSDDIYKSIIEKEKSDLNGLNGFVLLLHIGTDPRRKDKFYDKLDSLMQELTQKGYVFTSIASAIK